MIDTCLWVNGVWVLGQEVQLNVTVMRAKMERRRKALTISKVIKENYNLCRTAPETHPQRDMIKRVIDVKRDGSPLGGGGLSCR